MLLDLSAFAWGLVLAVLAGVVTVIAIAPVRRFALRRSLIDMPNARSSHDRPTPRGGGVALLMGIGAAALAGLPQAPLESTLVAGLLVSAAGMAGIGFIDDARGLSKRVRFLAGGGLVWLAVTAGIRLEELDLAGVVRIPLGDAAPLVTAIWLLAVPNLYNFMDGIDGLAGMQAVAVGVTLAIVAALAGNAFVCGAALIVAGAAAGFLVYNWPPASIFLGDVGSWFLGFAFAALAVIGAKPGEGSVPFIVPVTLLSPFLLDTMVTLIRRVPKGRRWLEAHRDHYYQRLVRAGYSHRRVTLVYAGLNVIVGAAVLAYVLMDVPAVLAVPVGCFGVLAAKTRQVEARSRAVPLASTV